MKYMLDTNICIYIIKKNPTQVVQRFISYQKGDLGISSIVLAELEKGVEKSANKEKNRLALNLILDPLKVVPFGKAEAKKYGSIRAYLEKTGISIGGMDTLIAAHAVSLGVPIITNNVSEFERVPGLKVENWL